MRILYVEDDPINRKVMQAMMSKAGLQLDEAVDGQVGLDRVEHDAYDLILMDLRMPNMDGLTAIKHIRAREDEKAQTPIIVVTADTADNMRAECLAQGANDIVYKPVPFNRLFELIAAHVPSQGGHDLI